MHPGQRSMTIKLLSAVDLQGGAGLAAYRLLQGLKEAGATAEMLVQDKSSKDSGVIGPRGWPCKVFGKILPYIDPVPKLIYPFRHRGAWSCNSLPNLCFPSSRIAQADILHLNWICGGFLPLRVMRSFSQPIIWTMHDSWPFTGGCHVPLDCRRYETNCGDCPQLRSCKDRDLSRLTWERKNREWRNLDITVVAPSRWMASCVGASSLLGDRRVEVIPNGLDITVFSPMDKQEARIILGLPTEGRFLLFSAMGGIASKEKGGDLLKACLERLAVEPNGNFTLLLSGCESSPEEGELPVPFINLGRLTEEGKMKQVYAAADLTVVSSRSESLGYVAMESLACGTPCVAFDHSGNKDVVDHMQNGYLARAYDPAGLAAGIRWILEDPARYKQLAEAGRKKIENVFSLRHVTRSYLDLYAEILSRG